MPEASEWISATNSYRWGKEGIKTSVAQRDYEIAAFFRQQVTKLRQQNPLLPEERAKERVSRDSARRTYRDVEGIEIAVWELHERALPEFKAQLVEDKHWLGVNKLRAYGVTNSKDVVERMMRSFADRKKEDVLLMGNDDDPASFEVEKKYVRLGHDMQGNRAWQIRETALGEFLDFVEQERRWISATDAKKLRDYGITSDHNAINCIAEDMMTREIELLSTAGMTPLAARVQVCRENLRLGVNSHGAEVMQIHADYAPQVAKRLGFISLLNRESLRDDYNVFGGKEMLDLAAQRFEELLIQEKMRAGISEVDAQREVNRNTVTYGVTKTGKKAWLLNRDALPEFARIVAFEKGWLSHAVLKNHGIGANADTVTLALAYLFDQEVKAQIKQGMSEEEAKAKVSSTTIRVATPKDAPPRWEIQKESLEMLRTLLASPDRDTWINEGLRIAKKEARRALPNGQSVSDPLEHLGERIASGREAYKPTWAVRVLDISESKKRSR